MLEVADVWLASWGYGYDPQAAALFIDAELEENFDEDTPAPYARQDRSLFRTTGAVMAARMHLLGFRSDWADGEVKRAWTELHAKDASLPADIDTLIAGLQREREAGLQPFDSPDWETLQHNLSSLDCGWEARLRYLVDRLPADAPVVLDLSAVWAYMEGEGYPRTPTFCADALAEVRSRAKGSMATIVLTEGSSDAAILEATVEIVRPHLAGYLTFLDYSSKSAGGVDSVVRGLRAFAAAGVANQVVGLLDNDTAGAQGADVLQRSPLPERMKPLQLPRLTLAAAYPTLGTEGLVTRDVNGIAVSIELFLGTDVLMNDDGELRPVHLTGWVAGANAYQGEVVGKAAVKERFWQKVDRARKGDIDTSTWEDLGHLVDYIVASS